MALLMTVAESISTKNTAVTDRLMFEIAGGSTEALENLYNNVRSSVYGFALSLLKNTHDAEDILQDCFVAVYSSISSYKPNGKPMAWILTITRNLCYRKMRERKRNYDIPQEDWEPYLSTNQNISAEDKLVLTQCMTLLDDEERQTVILHAVAGFKHREIAELMDMPLATIISKYNRSLKKLENALREGGR